MFVEHDRHNMGEASMHGYKSAGLLLSLLVFLGLAVSPAASAAPATRTVVDAAGRQVEIPAEVKRVLAAGPPASVLLYTLAPDKLLGWTRELKPDERAFMPARYADLPVLGRLTGKGNTANIESVLAMKPDLILDVGSIDPTYVSLADRVQQQTGIPYLLLDGSFAATAATYRQAGELLGDPDRGAQLADYAEQTLGNLQRMLAAIPGEQRPRVYYGRGPEGLETGLGGSINVEVLEAVGAVNVAAAAGKGSLATVSLEQVLGWDPQVILTLDAGFYRDVLGDSRWQGVAAIRDRRVFLAPSLPFGWFDSPPGVNRLIGVRWLEAVLYPQAFPEDLRVVTRDFYRRFYHVTLDDGQLDQLLDPATKPPS
ncbi:MAG TPA: iron ABC transporter substrate-binding protein [Dongiaceae bacterium]|nr:iron ABC transporter substrate-binding protein [Dongiaceae bacterium]